MDNKKSTGIKIDLENSTNAHSFVREQLIHQVEFDKTSELIEKQINWVLGRKELPEANYNRVHNTISIFGDRGTGKTSFLHSLLEKYKKYSTVEVFDIIDPTLIEEKGHIFLLLISLINGKVTECLAKGECKPNSLSYEYRRLWNNQLKELAQGIPSLDGVGSTFENTSWQDQEYIMEKGLYSVNAAFQLERNFHKLVSLALRILDKKVFLIAFDDIDVDFKKGWPVLEVIRKYLTTPYIVTLLSGNMKLYIKNIRKQQWRNFGEDLLVNEARRSPSEVSEYTKLVNEIEGQYMLKILKSENRVHLHTLYESIQLYNPSYQIVSETNTCDLLEKYKEILNLYGIKNQYQLESYSSFLLTLSVRSQIHFLLTNQNGIPNDISCIEAFIGRMYAHNINIDLAAIVTKMLTLIVLKFLLHEKMLVEAYQLQPTTDNVDLNSCLMGFSLLYSKKLSYNPFLVFDYFIRIGYVRNLLGVFDYKGDNKGWNINKLCQYAGMFQDKILRDIVGNSIAYIESAGFSSKVTGNFSILGLEAKAHTSLTNRIDSVFKKENLENQILGFIPLCILQSSTKNESLLYYSVNILLGTIGELAKVVKLGGDVKGAFVELSQVKSYQLLSDVTPVSANEMIQEWVIDSVDEDGAVNNDISELVDAFTMWVQNYKQISYSPHFLGKISTRFYYAMKRIHTCNLDWDLGTLMHRCIIAFMNAVLIEEAKENYEYEKEKSETGTIKGDKYRESINKLNVNNAIQTDEIFLNNLQFIQRNGAWECVGFSIWLFQCPLLIAYLNFEEKEDLLYGDNSPFVSKILSAVPARFKTGKIASCLSSVLRKDKSLLGSFANCIKKPKKVIQILKDRDINYDFIITKGEDEIKSKLEEMFSVASINSISEFKNILQSDPGLKW